MNYNKFFLKAKEKGIENSQLTFNKTKETTITVFHNEIEKYSISDQSSINAKGIYNNQLASVSTESVDNKSIDTLVDSLINMASKLEKDEKPVIFKGSEKYFKKNTYNKELSEINIDEKIKMLFEIEKLAYKESSYVSEVEVSYGEEDFTKELYNSYGLKLKSNINNFSIFMEVVCKKDNEVKSGFDVIVGSDFSKVNPSEFVKKVVNDTVSQFGGESCEAKTYKVVLNEISTSNLLQAMVNTGLSAENIQKKTSVLVDKLDTKVFSNKITIEDRPLDRTCWFRYFDDEGVATNNKKLVDKGVIKAYLYNLEAAGRENKESTGNGFSSSIKAINLTLKPGKKTENELFEKVQNGIYVTSISGLHSGLDSNSGDFSLVANGYYIKDGKIDKPATLLTIGGNIYKLFDDIIDVGSNSKINYNSVNCPSIAVKNIKVSSL